MNASARFRGSRPRRSHWAWVALALCIASCSRFEQEREVAAIEVPVTRTYEGDGARLELSLDRESLTTAESAVLRLEVECAETAEVRFPDTHDGFGEFAVIREDALPVRLLDDGRVVRGREYVLQPFLPGKHELPVLEVTLNESSRVSTEPVGLVVESVLDDPQTAELRDITEPVDIPVPWWWWVAIGLGLAAALAGMAWWWKRRKGARSVERQVPAHEAALAALEALLAENLLARGGCKPFYLRLSDIVRRYVEERFGLPASEQTTEEFLAAMSAAPVIRTDHRTLLRGFLQEADMVKFAEFVPAADEVGGAVEAAKRLIEQTVPDEPIVREHGRGLRVRAPKGVSSGSFPPANGEWK